MGLVYVLPWRIAPREMPSTVINQLGMIFVKIPKGEFLMGSPRSELGVGHNSNVPTEVGWTENERPQRRVLISQPFYLGAYEVTQAQWVAVMGDNPLRFKEASELPMTNVSWREVQAFIQRLNERERGARYRLPTEAEWEYAARAGSVTAYSFGDDALRIGEYAWCGENSDASRARPVGQRQPNAWGLYDMHGNVGEWVRDWFGEYRQDEVTDPTGARTSSYRVVRGGSWLSAPDSCRSAFRNFARPGFHSETLGFRLLRETFKSVTAALNISMTRPRIEATYEEPTNPMEFLVEGAIDAVNQGKTWWIGARSGDRFWPHMELSLEVQKDKTFYYRLTIPSDLRAGTLVLIEVGPKSSQVFRDHLVGQYQKIELHWTHHKDLTVRAAVDIP